MESEEDPALSCIRDINPELCLADFGCCNGVVRNTREIVRDGVSVFARECDCHEKGNAQQIL
jgi:hypothetical protein